MSDIAEKAVIELRAETEQLRIKLAEAEAQIAGFRQKAESADDSGLGFKKSVAAVKSWIGSVTAAIGVGVAFFNIGQKISAVWTEFFTTGNDKARQFKETLDFTDIAGSVAKLETRIGEVQNRLNQASGAEGLTAQLLTIANMEFPSKLKEELASLRTSAENARASLAADKERDLKALALNDMLVQDAKLVTDEVMRVQLEGLEREKAVRKKYAEIRSKEGEALVDELIKREKRITDAKIAEIEKQRAAEVNEEITRRMLDVSKQMADEQERAAESAEKALEAQRAATREIIKQRTELRALQDQQRQGFDLADLADDAAGTGAVLQLINSAIARGGGR